MLTALSSYQSYVSALILVYHATHLNIAGASEEQCRPSLDLASAAINVLRFCEELDPVARSLLASLTAHWEALRIALNARRDAAGQASQPETAKTSAYDYLFVPHTSDAEQHMPTNLVDELCDPYAHGFHMAADRRCDEDPESTFVQSSGDRQEPLLVQHRVPSNSYKPHGSMTPGTSNIEDGYFINSKEPSWWVAKRSSVDYSRDASTLKIL